MELSKQEYWSGLPCPSPGDLPDPGFEPRSPTLAGKFFTIWATREAHDTLRSTLNPYHLVLSAVTVARLSLFTIHYRSAVCVAVVVVCRVCVFLFACSFGPCVCFPVCLPHYMDRQIQRRDFICCLQTSWVQILPLHTLNVWPWVSYSRKRQ